jgi:Alpha/beta hydrolase family
MSLARVPLVVAATLFAAGVVFVAWASNAAPAEPTAYATAMSDPRITIERDGGFITIQPAKSERPSIGFMFYPGARVSPEAYVSRLSELAARARIAVVIGRPRLNLAVFSISQADTMRAAIPGIKRWYVGGHSLGGAMACLYASKSRQALEGVVLFGTYCGTNISTSGLRVLLLAGERDGLFPPEKVLARRGELPGHAHLIQLPGVNHAQFGSYGPQVGDHPSAIDEAGANDAIVSAVTAFFEQRDESSNREEAPR